MEWAWRWGVWLCTAAAATAHGPHALADAFVDPFAQKDADDHVDNFIGVHVSAPAMLRFLFV